MKFTVSTMAFLLAWASQVTVANAAAIDLLPKQATLATRAANRHFSIERDFDGSQEIEDTKRGFIAALTDSKILDAKGVPVWDIGALASIQGATPDTVNPSLWQSAKFTAQHGLFKVCDGIYQLRGYDVENMMLVEGKTGWIVVDPMMSSETAKAAMELVNRKLGTRPISAMIYSHSHADHF